MESCSPSWFAERRKLRKGDVLWPSRCGAQTFVFRDSFAKVVGYFWLPPCPLLIRKAVEVNEERVFGLSSSRSLQPRMSSG
jgi:hypothetical protein